jgi:hypothetical protein
MAPSTMLAASQPLVTVLQVMLTGEPYSQATTLRNMWLLVMVAAAAVVAVCWSHAFWG